MAGNTSLSGIERHSREDGLLVSKTDLKGWLAYCNDVFHGIAGYSGQERPVRPSMEHCEHETAINPSMGKMATCFVCKGLNGKTVDIYGWLESPLGKPLRREWRDCYLCNGAGQITAKLAAQICRSCGTETDKPLDRICSACELISAEQIGNLVRKIKK